MYILTGVRVKRNAQKKQRAEWEKPHHNRLALKCDFLADLVKANCINSMSSIPPMEFIELIVINFPAIFG